MPTSLIKNVSPDAPPIRPAAKAAGTFEPNDLSRFEGEGGHEAPAAALVDVPLDNAVWRRLPPTARDLNQANPEP